MGGSGEGETGKKSSIIRDDLVKDLYPSYCSIASQPIYTNQNELKLHAPPHLLALYWWNVGAEHNASGSYYALIYKWEMERRYE